MHPIIRYVLSERQQRPEIGLYASALIALVITTLSLWPVAHLPAVPGTDKTHHIIAYALLAFPTALTLPHKMLKWGVLYICFGGMIELIQPYVNRYGEWLDFTANTAGVITGSLLGYIAARILIRAGDIS